ncbi:MAG: hypothetical protein K2I46_01560 [Clostridia bacterium]|nr:hypothetical protein [Clostridia bacterium]
MTNYFRITAYYENEDLSMIIDSNGMFEKLWQFSSYVLQKGLKVLEVSNADNFLDVNTELAEKDTQHVLLRAVCKGKTEYITQTINGKSYKAVKVDDLIYIPDKTQII